MHEKLLYMYMHVLTAVVLTMAFFSQSFAGFELEDEVLVPHVVTVFCVLPNDHLVMTQHLHSIPHAGVEN